MASSLSEININTLSPEQKHAYQKFIAGENIFLTGPGGTGKSQLIKTMFAYTQQMGIKCQVCALTGTASVLLNMKAKTIHSWSGINIASGTKDYIVTKVFANKRALSNWRTVKVLIIDEVSMMSLKIFEVLEYIGRVSRRNMATPFGGIQVVFSGDFFQLPPVGDERDISTCQLCFESPEWLRVFSPTNHIQLKTMFRQIDPLFQEIMMAIRVGELRENHIRVLKERVGIPKPEGKIITRIFPIKKKVELINKYNFDQLDTPEFTWETIVKTNLCVYLDSMLPIQPSIMETCRSLSSIEIELEVNRLKTSIPTEGSTVSLKIGTLVMLTQNLAVDEGLCNGSQGIIIDIVRKSMGKAELFMSGTGDSMIDIPIVKFNNGMTSQISPKFWQSEDYPSIAVGQIPLIHCWALTIHKIQGATLDMAEIDLGPAIFVEGQSYVGLSRVKSLNGLFLSAFHPTRIRANETVKNFYAFISKMETMLPEPSILTLPEPAILPQAEAIVYSGGPIAFAEILMDEIEAEETKEEEETRRIVFRSAVPNLLIKKKI